jgi:SAM-dependent methyltransferase
MTIDHAHWSRNATQWIAWARTPGHDAFWAYRNAFLEFVGEGKGNALDVGCGEGRVGRLLRECGYQVTATDPVEPFVVAAREADSADHYRVAAAAELPFEDASFDLAVAYNVLMDIANVRAAVREVARVLRPSGTLIISVVHPFTDRGHFTGPEPDSPFVVTGSYFGRERFEATEERDGLKMHFAGWSQPLEAYMAALTDAGLAVTALKEPIPENITERWSRMPLFLWLKARSFPA